MPNYQFTLIVDGPDLQDDGQADALYESGCDDALIGRSHGVQHLDFDREAPSLDAAVLSAVADIERLDGLEVVRIAGAGLVSMADIAARLGRTRESVRLLIEGARGPGGFPPPATDPRSRYRLWRWPEVSRWLGTHLGSTLDEPNEGVFIAINAGLELRRHSGHVRPERRPELRQLVGL